MKIFHTPNVNISYDPISKQIRQTWIDFISSETFREAIDQTVAFTRSNTVKSIISDTLKQRAISPNDSEYAAAAMPELCNHGVEVMAFVIPENIFTKMALRKFAGVENAEIQLQFFSNIDEAAEWINSCIEP